MGDDSNVVLGGLLGVVIVWVYYGAFYGLATLAVCMVLWGIITIIINFLDKHLSKKYDEYNLDEDDDDEDDDDEDDED